MKSIFNLILFLFLSVTSLQAGNNYTWNGSTSDNWGLAGNWTANGCGLCFGLNTNNYSVNNTFANNPIISGNPGFTINDILLSGGAQLNMTAGTVNVLDDLVLTDGSDLIITGGRMNVAGDLYIYDNGSSITIDGGGRIVVTGDVFFGETGGGLPDGTNGSTSIVVNNGQFDCTNLTFSGSTDDSHSLTVNSPGIARITGDVSNASGGDVVISIPDGFMRISGNLNMTSVADNLSMNGGTLILDGNWTNSGTSNLSQGTVQFAGNIPQSITHPNTLSFYTLRMSNTTSNLTLNDSVIVQNRLIFDDGIIVGNGNTVTFLDGAFYTGISDASHINGAVNKIGNNNFTFPIGNGSFFSPIRLNSNPDNIADVFQAEYIGSNPDLDGYLFNNRAGGFTTVSVLEYWRLDRLTGTSEETIQLNWSPNSDVGDLSDLIIVRWDVADNEWKNEGNGGTTGNISDGTINTSEPVSQYGIFTFGSVAFGNPLPIELGEFNAKIVNNRVKLDWTTISEINNNHFIIERSLDGKEIEERNTVFSKASNGNSTMLLEYTYEEPVDFNGTAYYRITQVDHDGTTTEYPFKSVQRNLIYQSNSKEAYVYPNPSSTNRFRVELECNKRVEFQLFNINLKEIPVKVNRLNEGVYEIYNLSNSEGIHFLKTISLDGSEEFKMQKVILH